MARGSSSRPTKTVAPVVVRPERDSKAASVKESAKPGARYMGKAPNRPNPA